MRLPRSLRSVLVSLSLAGALVGSSGCVRGGPAAFGALQLAATAVEVIAVAAILAHHDAHFHAHGCGHAARYYDGRTNYYYNGHWEYYDGDAGVWYAY